jgi:hypothetical protein
MLNIFKILILALQYIVFVIYYIFEEFVIRIAKRWLYFIKKIRIYESFISYINSSGNTTLLSSFFIIALLAEASAIFAGYLMVHGFALLGVGFYILKILIFIPAVDIFKHNKRRLLSYSMIKYLYSCYITAIRTEAYRDIKRSFKKLKKSLAKLLAPIRNRVSKMVKKFFHND